LSMLDKMNMISHSSELMWLRYGQTTADNDSAVWACTLDFSDKLPTFC